MANKFKKALDTRSVKLEKVDKEADKNKILNEKENNTGESASNKDLNVKNSTSSHIDNDSPESKIENSASESGLIENSSIETMESEKNLEREIESSEISKDENDNNIDVNNKEEIVAEHIDNENQNKKEKKTTRSKKVSKSKTAANDKIPDILAQLGIEGKKEYKNKTYYLSVKVVEEISRIAKLKGMSESKLINDLLEKILF